VNPGKTHAGGVRGEIGGSATGPEGQWSLIDLHLGLASLYETDSRFAENINKHGEGLTDFFVAAIRANAKRNEG